MKHILTSSFLLALSLLSGSGAALAQAGHAMTHDAMPGMQSGQPAAAQANTGIGTVNAVDLQHNTVNLTHGPIKTLGWSGMTMDFTVKDASLLAGIKPGDRVEFNVVKEGPSRFYIDRIKHSK